MLSSANTNTIAQTNRPHPRQQNEHFRTTSFHSFSRLSLLKSAFGLPLIGVRSTTDSRRRVMPFSPANTYPFLSQLDESLDCQSGKIPDAFAKAQIVPANTDNGVNFKCIPENGNLNIGCINTNSNDNTDITSLSSEEVQHAMRRYPEGNRIVKVMEGQFIEDKLQGSGAVQFYDQSNKIIYMEVGTFHQNMLVNGTKQYVGGIQETGKFGKKGELIEGERILANGDNQIIVNGKIKITPNWIFGFKKLFVRKEQIIHPRF